MAEVIKRSQSHNGPKRRLGVQRNSSTIAERFEQFNANLKKGHTRTEAADMLKDPITARSHELLAAYTNPDTSSEERRAAFWGLAVLLSVQGDLLRKEQPRKTSIHYPQTYWLGFAREAIRQFVEEDPENRGVLLTTAFFSEDPGIQRDLGRFVHSTAEISGPFDKVSLAVGLATGRDMS